MSIYKTAISSMNYFFLRIVTDKPHDDITREEVTTFIQQLAKDHTSLTDDILEVIKDELIDGDYFTDKSITDIEGLINSATDDLTGNPLPEIAQFYIDLLKKAGQLTGHTLVREGPVTIDFNGLGKKYPLAKISFQLALSHLNNIQFIVRAEDNVNYDSAQEQTRVYIQHAQTNQESEDILTILIPNEFITYEENIAS